MAQTPRYLIGYGESLIDKVEIGSSGGPKEPPYTLEEAQDRVSKMLDRLTVELDALPDAACPRDEAVAAITLHPEYLAKSYYPSRLLDEVGLQAVGSRSVRVTPEKRSKDRVPEETPTTQLFIAGPRSNFKRFASKVELGASKAKAFDMLPCIEKIGLIQSRAKVKGCGEAERFQMEVVLHASEAPNQRYIVHAFMEYMRSLGVDIDTQRQFYAGGLCFVKGLCTAKAINDVATFSYLRVLREMPKLRITKPIHRTQNPAVAPIELPNEDAIDPSSRVAVFDGGVESGTPFDRWVTAIDAPGVGEPDPDHVSHGTAVTSALLFGPLKGGVAPRPICRVDHYRVLDVNTDDEGSDLYEVLDRIVTVLDSADYDYVSMSIGPCMPIDDDEVHAWTAMLDAKLSQGRTLLAVAVGNDGELPDDPAVQLWRVQVPADCVNAIAVGASSLDRAGWTPAPYSSRGPGRSPGIVKPDVIAFGGDNDATFNALGTFQDLASVGGFVGTSLATPYVMRMASAIRARFGSYLSPLAVKALLIHGAEQEKYDREAVGWGCLYGDPERLIVCPDGMARVVYQDQITASKYRRIRIPVPSSLSSGMVNIRATFCFSTEVDPEHAGNYTRSGLEVRFRPDMSNYRDVESMHPVTAPFFSAKSLYAPEHELRADAHKWETCLHATKRMRAGSLVDPTFDIHYNSRFQSRADGVPREIRYALIITIESKRTKDLYDRVVAQYRNRLRPLTPAISIPISF